MPRPRSTLDLRQAALALTDDAGRPRPMHEIAAVVGVAKPTLYRLATSRTALETACVEAETERLIGRLAGVAAGTDEREWLAAVVAALEALVADSPAALRVLFEGGAGAAASVRRIEDRLADALRRAGAVPAGIPPGEAAAALLGAGVAVVRRRRAQTA